MNKEDQIRELRAKNDEKIHEYRNFEIDWQKFKYLVYLPGENPNKESKKKALQPKDRLHFETRDKGECYICGSTFHYGSCNEYLYTYTNYKLCHLHHVIPNGGIEDNNIVTLCTHCHQMVHQAMYIAGTGKYSRPL